MATVYFKPVSDGTIRLAVAYNFFIVHVFRINQHGQLLYDWLAVEHLHGVNVFSLEKTHPETLGDKVWADTCKPADDWFHMWDKYFIGLATDKDLEKHFGTSFLSSRLPSSFTKHARQHAKACKVGTLSKPDDLQSAGGTANPRWRE